MLVLPVPQSYKPFARVCQLCLGRLFQIRLLHSWTLTTIPCSIVSFLPLWCVFCLSAFQIWSSLFPLLAYTFLASKTTKMSFFWLLKNGLGPPRLASKLPSAVSTRCSYSLRRSHSSQVPLCSTAARCSSFLVSSCLIWNSLSTSSISVNNLSAFKHALDVCFSHDRFTFGLPPWLFPIRLLAFFLFDLFFANILHVFFEYLLLLFPFSPLPLLYVFSLSCYSCPLVSAKENP